MMPAMPPSWFLRYLLLPATVLTVPVFIVIISALAALVLPGTHPPERSQLLEIAMHGGLLALPALALMTSWLLNYCFVLLEATANGAREPPVLAIEMLNPVHEWRPAFQLALVLMLATLLSTVAMFVDGRLASALAVLSFVALPASTAALALSSTIWQSVHPGALWHIARTLGPTYLAIVAIILVYGLVTWWLVAHFVFWWPLCAWIMFAWLSVFTLIGGSLYEHRIELGHQPTDSPERRETRQQAEVSRERGRLMDRIHAQARSGNLAGAWGTIQGELSEQHHAFATYDWLLDALSERKDVRLTCRLAQEYLTHALGRDNTRAILIAQRGLAIDSNFRPRSGAQCLRVAELLRLSGDRRSAQSLLRDFGTCFPGDPAVADAERLLATITRH
jgi:hypothetical protein